MEIGVISAHVAGLISAQMATLGIPPSNRLVIATLDVDTKLPSGLIIPKGDKDGLAKRGVQIQCGELTEEYREYNNILGTGLIIYYGDYAGKEITEIKSKLKDIKLPDGLQIRVLSINEVIYVQNNN